MSLDPLDVDAEGVTAAGRARGFRPKHLVTGPSRDDKSFLGHPGGLPWMLQVEMWERFSWFGMRAILVYFITDTLANGGLGLPVNAGQVVMASYGAAVLLMTIPGGIFADRILGPWVSTLWGGLIIMTGHVILAIPQVVTSWIGLVCIAIGTGFIKPNLSTVVGGLYDDGDPRRDQGFLYFYMSINIGSLIAPLITGLLKDHYGYHIGFIAAAIGMALALVAFIHGRSKLRDFAFDIPNPLAPGEGRRMVLRTLGIIAIGAVLVIGFKALLGEWTSAIAYSLFTFATVTALGYFLTMFRSSKVTERERGHLWAFVPLWVGQVLFVMIFEQAAGKMATFAKANTDGHIAGSALLKPEQYQMINPAAVLILAGLLGMWFRRREGKFPNTPQKFAISVFIIGLTALMMGFGFQSWPGGDKLAPWWFLAVVFVIQTVAELFMNPIGLSTATKLAPKKFASQNMTLWLLAAACGQGLASVTIERTKDLGDVVFYYGLGIVTIVVAVVLFAIAPWTQSKMEDVDQVCHEGAGATPESEGH
ncbi:MAG: oligopeptide:H+ symporter [Cutibacterium avidum]|nr:oligopeptide:H+ symporter [Cutibacterium avidum]MDU3282652.1 oligopeptide:H+ symporter [Cutibacterium avidum]MDU3749148.1 oligopeptide:H+ symporter [Cutibacterium avidum]MDU7485411.1 oligopeptide:H+ symporter [Cutibacterium avidum]